MVSDIIVMIKPALRFTILLPSIMRNEGAIVYAVGIHTDLQRIFSFRADLFLFHNV